MDEEVCFERVAELAQHDRLRDELERVFGGLVACDVVVALRCGERSASATLAQRAVSSGPVRAAVRVGCVAKLLTAMLARRAFEDRRLAPDEQSSDLFPAGAARSALRGITIRQLLEHTHGLDDSLLSAPPKDPRGRIDPDALARALRAAPPLAPPGALYSYGNAGACVIAALLERLGSRPYSAQLVDTLLAPLGIDAVGSAGSVCPASGGDLALDPSDLLNLVAEFVFAVPDAWPDDRRSGDYGFAIPLPGWNPLERGVYLGWKYHGAGWFGHQSVWPGQSVLVRAHPRRRLALVTASSGYAAAIVAARVFGGCLPELFELKIPTRPNATLAPPTGAFGCSAWRVDIRQSGGEPALHAQGPGGCGDSSAALRAAVPGLWLTRPVLSAFPHVEHVELERGYLWNGRFVLPRVARQMSS